MAPILRRALAASGLVAAMIVLGLWASPIAAQSPQGKVVDDDVFINTVWTRAQSPYIVTRLPLRVYAEATLTIEPGVEVRFAEGGSIMVEDGRLIANGTAALPITLTADSDTPTPGHWRGLFLGYLASNCQLRHVKITYAGRGGDPWENKVRYSSLTIRAAGAIIENCEIAYSLGNGIELADDEERTEIVNCLFHHNGSAPEEHHDLLGLQRTLPARVQGCTFASDLPFPIALPPGAVGRLGANTMPPNGRIQVWSTQMGEDATWPNVGAPYLVVPYDVTSPNMIVAGPDAPVLTLQPGVTVQFADGVGLFIGTLDQPGALVADGTALPIVLTSASPGSSVRWAGLNFDRAADTSASVIKGVQIAYGGRGYPWHDTTCEANINIYQSAPRIENCEIHHGAQHGISIYQGSPTIVGNSFHDNGRLESHFDIMADLESTPLVRDNRFGAGTACAVLLSAQAMGQMRNNTFDPLRGAAVGGGLVTTSATWTQQGMSHYLIVGDIWVGGTANPVLTLEPGLTLKFAEWAGLYVGAEGQPGALRADGGVLPIRFTRAGATGYWPGLFFDGACDSANTLLAHAIVEHGGSGQSMLWHGSRWEGSINIYQTSPTIRDSEIAYASRHGVAMEGGAPVIRGSYFHDNGSKVSDYDILTSASSAPVIEGNQLGPGAAAQRYALKLGASSVGSLKDNIFHPTRAVHVLGGTIAQDATWTSQGMSHYFIADDVTVAGANTPLLTLAAGVTLKFDRGDGLFVGTASAPGALTADGAAAPVRLTWNTAGERWAGLFMDETADGARSILYGLIVENGGESKLWRNRYWNANINLYGCAPTIRSSIIGHAARHGIELYNAQPTLLGNAFMDNGVTDTHYDILCNSGSAPTIRYNTFQEGPTWAVKIPVAAIGQMRGNDFRTGRGAFVMGGALTQDSVLEAQGTYYYFDTSVTVAGEARPVLRIAPGATLKFGPEAGLFIGTAALPGGIIADGASRPITMTRSVDVSPGSWPGLFFDAAADDALCLLDGVTIQYASYRSTTWNAKSWNGMVNLYQASPTLRNCAVVHGYRHGIQMEGSEALISGSRFADNGSAYYDIYGDPTSTPYLVGNAFNSSSPYAIRASLRAAMQAQGNAFAAGRAVHVIGGNLESDGTFHAEAGLSHYRIEGNIVVAGPTAPSLTIEPGVTVKFDKGSGLYIGSDAASGALIANGQAAPITLTQEKSGLFYRWSGLFLHPSLDRARTVIKGVTLDYGGDTTSWRGQSWYGNVNIDGGAPLLDGCTSTNAQRYGVQMRNSAATIQGCTIASNPQYGIWSENGAPAIIGGSMSQNGSTTSYGDILLQGSLSARIEGIRLSSAAKYGLYCDESSPLVRGATIENHDIGIYIKGPTSSPRITRSTIRRNGAGVYNSLNSGLPVIGGAAGEGNLIAENTRYGVENADRYRCLDARYNDWGSPDGPEDLSGKADACVDAVNEGLGDLVSDYVYYLNSAGSTTPPPEPPSAVSPLGGTAVGELRPTLVVANSAHAPGQPVTYAFQVATQPNFSYVWRQGEAVPEGSGTTSWQVTADVTMEKAYYWRARAFDGARYSYWSAAADFLATSQTPTPTATATQTPTPTRTWTRATTPTATATRTATPVVSPTPTITWTPLPTLSPTSALPKGQLCLAVFLDRNRSGGRDASEPYLPGVKLAAQNLLGQTVASCTSQASGPCCTALDNGWYALQASELSGYLYPISALRVVYLTSGATLHAEIAAVEKPTITPTPSHTATRTDTPTITPTETATASPTATNTPSPTATASNTPLGWPTGTPTQTFTPTATTTWTATATLTATPSPTGTATPTLPAEGVVILQQGLQGYTGARDTFLDATNPEANYGSGQQLNIRWPESNAPLVAFDASQFPTNTQILSAKLRLYVVSGGGASMQVRAFQVLRPWAADRATWSEASQGLAWAEPGANGVGTDREEESCGQATLMGADRWCEIDISAAFREWVARPDENHGLLLQGEAFVSKRYQFASSDLVWPSEQRPLVAVEYRRPVAEVSAVFPLILRNH